MTIGGVYKGEKLLIGVYDGEPVYVTLWDHMLILVRNKLPHPLVIQWNERYLVGGRFWKEIPHPMCKNPKNTILYEDTFWSAITKPIRNRLLTEPYKWLKRIDGLRARVHRAREVWNRG